jgi:hypothetical protein
MSQASISALFNLLCAYQHPSLHTNTSNTPDSASVPPNVSFYVDDLEDEWNFSAKFDFIFSRFMTGSIRNWSKYLKQCYEYVIFPVPRPDHQVH